MEYYQRMRNLFDVMEEGHLLLEVDSSSSGTYTYFVRECNLAVLSIFTLKKEDLLNQSLFSIGIMNSDNYKQLTTMLEDVYLSGQAAKRDVYFSDLAIDATIVAAAHGNYIDLLLYNWSKRDIFGGLDQNEDLLKVFVSRQLCYVELTDDLEIIRFIGDTEKVLHLSHDDIDSRVDILENLIYHKDYDLFLQSVKHIQEHKSQQLNIRLLGHYGEKIWVRVDLLKIGPKLAMIIENIDYQKQIEVDFQVQKEKIRTVQNMTRMGEWEWDAESDQYNISEGLMKILDVAPKELEEVKIFYKNRVGIMANELSQSMMGHENVYEYLKADGQRIWLSDKQQCQYDDAGNVSAIFGITQEITRNKEVYDQMVKMNSEYEAIYHSMKAAILVVDVLENGHFVYKNANAEALMIFDCSLDEIVGASPENLMGELGHQLLYHYTNCTKNMESIRVLERMTRYGQDYKLILLLSPTIEEGRVSKIVVSAVEHF